MKSFKVLLALIGLIGLLLSVGCASKQVRFDSGDAAYEENARRHLSELQKNHPQGDLTYIQALKTFIQKYEDSGSAWQAKFLLAQGYYKQDLLSEAYKILNDMLAAELPTRLKVKTLYLLALNAKKLELTYEATRWHIQLLPLLKSRTLFAKIKAEVLEAIETELEKEHLEALLSEEREGFPLAELHFRMGRVLYDEAELSSAESHFNQALELTTDIHEKEKIQDFIVQMNKTYLTQKHIIGAVLPLTGKYEEYGLKSLRAIQYALDFFKEEPETGPEEEAPLGEVPAEASTEDILGTPDFELAIYDSQGDPERAALGVETLLEKYGVIAIIGPLLSSASDQAAIRAQQLQVPLMNLSQHPTITEIGDYIYRISMTKDQQTDALVKYACEIRKLKKYAILYPEDSYGIEFSNQFWTKIEACGGEVIGIETYKPRQSSFNDEIKKLVGLYYPKSRKYEYRLIESQLKMEQNRDEIREKEVKLKPIIDFEAIFIPDYARTIGQIAPALAYYDIENVMMLGTQGWNSKDLIRRGTEYVQDAVFVDGFFADHKSDEVQSFVNGFEETFSERPQIWEAQAFDAAQLLLTLLAKEDVQSRIQLKNELVSLSEVTGVTGRMDFSNQSDVKKDLFLLTVKNNAIVALDLDTLESSE